ncbi:MAG: class I SAM-dependent methyltransferase [Halanaeroarchaeum sp.]
MSGEGSDEPSGIDRSSVRATYDRIAPHFAAKRKNPWPEVESFLAGRRVETAVDVGCANGRHTELLAEIAQRAIGIDVSRELLIEARSRQSSHGFAASVLLGDAVKLPVTSDAIDLALYVATMHHLATRTARVASLDELARILRDGGTALLSVWSTAHDRFEETSGFDTTVTFTLPDGSSVPRFYHIYDREEFEAELTDSALSVDRVWVSHGNCYAVVGS